MEGVDVATIGELLIDFVPTAGGVTLAEAEAFVKAPGGAPANVAVGVARLGCRAAFLGKVGDDPFGHYLAGVLRAGGVDVSQLVFDAAARTALAFVSLTSSGERDFMFYRHPSADMRHDPSEIDEGFVSRASVLHHGSISLIQEPARSATLTAIEVARKSGALVSYDPNLRLPLWPSPEAARRGIMSAWGTADMIKISDDELAFLSGEGELARARGLMHDGLQLLLVTLGERGAYYLTPEYEGLVPGFAVDTIDTTGAGDAFVAAMLVAVRQRPDLAREQAELFAAVRRANACGALATTIRGAIPALPTAEQVDAFLRMG